MSKVLNLPPLSGVKDPEVRAILQAMYTWMQVRDGQVRDGANKFLTESDVGNTVNNYMTALGGGSNVTYPPGSDPGSIKSIIDALARSVINSPTYIDLVSRINRIEQPTWLSEAIRAAIGNVYNKVEVNAVRFEQASAAIGREVQLRADREQASVTSLNAMLAAFGVNTAGITTLEQVTASAEDALASTITQLNADVGDALATAESGFTLAQTVEGWAKASYYVKVDLDGYVTGFSFGVEGETGHYTSDFVVVADTFAVVEPGEDPVVPFIVRTTSWDDGGVTRPAGVYMGDVYIVSANIGDAVITAAKIKDGEITSAKIGDYIQSTSYNPATHTGWRINKDGSAYFGGDVTIDGTLSSDTFESGVSAAVVTGSASWTGTPCGDDGLSCWSVTVSTGLSRPALVSASSSDSTSWVSGVDSSTGSFTIYGTGYGTSGSVTYTYL